MTYDEMLALLGERLNYERKGMPANRELRLDRTESLLDALGRPHDRYPVIHVAGTKGKGSTAHMIAAMLAGTGYRVGLHTSPHFHRLEERFAINGEIASPERLASIMEELRPLVEGIDARLTPDQPELTFFEITTALCLLYFAREAVDWGVIEVGMGGRLDSTNVVSPRVSVITSISRDHVKQLGDTLELIAEEKSGIIKPGRPVVSGVTASGPREVIERAAARNGSELRLLGRDFDVDYEGRGLDGGTARVHTWRGDWPATKLKPPGAHQARNAALAAATMELLSEQGVAWTREDASEAISRVVIPGRTEVVATRPTVVLDVAHNDASLAALLDTLDVDRPWRRTVAIFAVARDKEWTGLIERVAGWFDHVILTRFVTNPRSVSPEEMAEAISDRSRRSIAADPSDAWRKAGDLLQRPALEPGEDLLCVTGSFYLVAEIREISRLQPIGELDQNR